MKRVEGIVFLIKLIPIGILKSQVHKRRITQQQMDSMMSNLTPQLDYSGFKQLDLVIEAIVEKLDVKQKLFADLEKHCSSNCILATNTSTLDVTQIGNRTKAQKRILGLHFFSPAHVMPLLEIIRTDTTSNQVLVDCLGFAKRIGKTAVIVGNCPGFVVNRVFYPSSEVANFLAIRGVHITRVDKVAKDFGMPMGIFLMTDMAGIDVMHYAGKTIAKFFKSRSYPIALLDALFKRKQFGNIQA